MIFDFVGLSVMEISSSSAVSDNDSIRFCGGLEVSSGDSEETLNGVEQSVSSQRSTSSGVDGPPKLQVYLGFLMFTLSLLSRLWRHLLIPQIPR